MKEQGEEIKRSEGWRWRREPDEKGERGGKGEMKRSKRAMKMRRRGRKTKIWRDIKNKVCVCVCGCSG